MTKQFGLAAYIQARELTRAKVSAQSVDATAAAKLCSNRMGKFDNKVVIVTGSSSGIGAATALAFATEGANVVITGRDKGRLSGSGDKCRAAGAEVLELISDLAKFENLEPLIKKTVDKFGRIDVLVNNAAYGYSGSIEQLNVEDYEAVFNTNLRAPFFLSKYALPHLKKTKGCIVSLSSTTARCGSPGLSAYSTSKAALEQFTRSFAAECAPFGVRVNCVLPASVDSGRPTTTNMSKEVAEELIKEYLKTQPFGSIQPEQIAEGILYLSSAAMVTGTSLVIDAGKLCSI